MTVGKCLTFYDLFGDIYIFHFFLGFPVFVEALAFTFVLVANHHVQFEKPDSHFEENFDEQSSWYNSLG